MEGQDGGVLHVARGGDPAAMRDGDIAERIGPEIAAFGATVAPQLLLPYLSGVRAAADGLYLPVLHAHVILADRTAGLIDAPGLRLGLGRVPDAALVLAALGAADADDLALLQLIIGGRALFHDLGRAGVGEGSFLLDEHQGHGFRAH